MSVRQIAMQHRTRFRFLLRWLLPLALLFGGWVGLTAPVAAQEGAPPATASRVDDPVQYLPLSSTYAYVSYNAPVYASADAVRANNPFTYHGYSGQGSAWVSAYQSTTIAGRNYYWVTWGWGSSGWMPADALRFRAPLSSLRGVDLRQRPGEQLAMVYGSNLNIRSEPGVISDATWVGSLSPYDVVAVQETRVVNGTTWYRIGPGQWIHSGYVRNFTPSARPDGVGPGERWIEVNLTEQVVIAHEGDTPVYATLTSTGRPGYETVTGLYRIWIKHRNAPMRWATANPPYAYADVPYIMYFHRGYGLHGAYWHDNFGTVQSAGCVNLSPYDSLWFFNWASPNVPEGTRMVQPSQQDPGTWVWVHY